MSEECENVRGLTQGEAVLEAMQTRQRFEHDNVNCTHVLGFDRAAVLSNLLVDAGLFPAHAASGPIFRRIEPNALVLGLHQFDDGFTRSHVDLEFAAAQLVPEMLAQRLLVDPQLLGDVGLSEAENRSALDERALSVGRLKFSSSIWSSSLKGQ